MHYRVRRFVEGHVEVFALLRRARDLAADDSLLESIGGRAYFAVDNVVV